MKKKTKVIIQILSVYLTITASTASAQEVPSQTEETPAESDIVPAEIIADESRGVQTDTPNAETVIELEEIENSQASTLVQLLDSIPNVSLNGMSTPQGSTITIRGLGAQGDMYGADGTIGMVLDGISSGSEEIYRNSALFSLEPELFKKIIVNRGPSGSFKYNSGTFGGTVEVEVKDASDFLADGDKFSFRQKLSYDTNGPGEMTTSILSFAPNHKFDVLLSYIYRTRDDYIDGDRNSSSATAFEMPSYSVKSNFYIDDSSKITFLHTKSQIPAKDVPYNTFDPLWNGTIVDKDIGDETTYLQYHLNPLDNDLLNFKTKIFSKREDINISSPDTSSGIFNANHSTDTLGLSLLNDAFIDRGFVLQYISLGLELKKRERKSPLNADPTNTEDPAKKGDNDGSSPGGTDESFAVFLTNEISLGEKLKITPTIRFESQTLTSENNNAYLAFGLFQREAIPDGTSYDSQAITGGFSTSYKFNEIASVFTNLYYNETLPILDRIRLTDVTNTEKASTREIGFSYNNTDLFLKEDEFKGKLTLFSTNIYDGTNYSGIDKVDLKGLEFELSYSNPLFYMDFNTGLGRGTINDTDENFGYMSADSLQLIFGKQFMEKQVNTFIDIKHTRPQKRVRSGAEPSLSYTNLKLSSVYKPNKGFLEGYEFRSSIENLTDAYYIPYQAQRSAIGRNFKFSIAKTF